MFQEIYEIGDISKSKVQKKNKNINIKGKLSKFTLDNNEISRDSTKFDPNIDHNDSNFMTKLKARYSFYNLSK